MVYPLVSLRNGQQPKKFLFTVCAFSPPVTCKHPFLPFIRFHVSHGVCLLFHSAWLTPQDISKLQTHEIESYINEPYRKSGDLLSGYRIALDPTKWEEEQAQNAAVEEEPSDEVDQLASEGDEDGESKKSTKSKKRKRESDAATAPSKAKKAPKTKVEPVKKSTVAKGRKNGTKSKAVVESEDEGDQAEAEGEDEQVGSSRKATPPPTKKTKRDKEEEAEESEILFLFRSVSFF